MVTPVLPAPTGNGLAMRAAMVLRALAEHYRVTLLVVNMYSSPADRRLAPALAECFEEVHFRRASLPARIDPRAVPADAFDVVHVFRLASIPYARPWFETAGAKHLDLDDIESVSRPRIAALFRERGQMHAALAEESAASEALQAEIDALMTFDRVYVCSAEDVDNLPFCGTADVRVLPNVVDLPLSPLPEPAGDQPTTLLFVGNLGYFPNAEGLDYFAATVLPILRQTAPRPFRIRIVGHGASPSLKTAVWAPEIEVIGPVPEVAPLYAAANAVIVPIRAGGGTRIKVLEAFSFRRPVVATSLAVEGLNVQHHVHALLGDDAEMFAANCRQIMVDETLSRSLVDRAYRMVSDSYTPAAMVNAVAPDASSLRPR
jgi:glycosyltransferase involved in cell wall biosynthesis